MRDPDYPARVERVIRMRVEAWDTNCNSHIPRLCRRPTRWLIPLAATALPEAQTTHLGIVLGLAMGPAVGLGLGRFAYALLLPSMRLDLGWSYAQAGAMNTANAAGYLIGALAAAPFAARFGDKRGFLLGLLLTAASLLATGLTSDYAVLALLRAIAGAAGALSLITGGALARRPAEAAARDGPPWLLACISAAPALAW